MRCYFYSTTRHRKVTEKCRRLVTSRVIMFSTCPQFYHITRKFLPPFYWRGRWRGCQNSGHNTMTILIKAKRRIRNNWRLWGTTSTNLDENRKHLGFHDTHFTHKIIPIPIITIRRISQYEARPEVCCILVLIINFIWSKTRSVLYLSTNFKFYMKQDQKCVVL